MFEISSVIGLEEKKAKKVLKENGYNNIHSIISSKHNSKCDSLLVCAVRLNAEFVTLICGEFYLGLKEQ